MHEQALTKEASALFPSFRKFEGYYLVGGTALALQMDKPVSRRLEIGHRISIDFDFFSSEALAQNLLAGIKRVFSGKSVAVTYAAPEQLNLVINGVRATFFHYPYPVVKPFVFYKGVPLASIHEIAAMKAFVLGKRIAYKDYVDWYFLLRDAHVNLEQAIGLAQKKFGPDFNSRLFLGQLVSLEDVPTQKIDFLKEEPKRETIAHLLEKTVKEYMR